MRTLELHRRFEASWRTRSEIELLSSKSPSAPAAFSKFRDSPPDGKWDKLRGYSNFELEVSALLGTDSIRQLWGICISMWSWCCSGARPWAGWWWPRFCHRCTVGEPPNFATILNESDDKTPVCWSIYLQNEAIGWAANKTVRRSDGITDLYSRVYLGDLPWDELAPGWLTAVLRPVFNDLDELDIEKKSRLVIDPLGRLVEFESRIRLANIVDAIKVQGQIENSKLRLTVQSGDLPYKLEQHLPPNSLMSDELSPHVRMPGLRTGQIWTVPLYSPFRSPSAPMEILQAIVEREDSLTWGGRAVPCRVIVYRGDSGSGQAGDEVRGRVWVDRDGMVLRQEVAIFRSHLHFIRLPAADAELLAEELGDDWSANLPSGRAEHLLRHVRADAL